MNATKTQFNLENRPCIILTNFGDDSLALIQWALESDLLSQHRAAGKLKVVYVETGFAASGFAERVEKCQAFVTHAGLESIHLKSKIHFQEAILGRGAFPNAKFQWCSTVLKGLPLLDWLDEIDPGCLAVILTGKRRETLLPPYNTLAEWQDKSEHFNDRSLWHPLIEYNELRKNALLKRTKLDVEPLLHRSLECDPCINSSIVTLAKLAKQDLAKVKELEQTLGSPFFAAEEFAGAVGIEAVVLHAKQQCAKYASNPCLQDLTLFYRGCGNPFGCGI